MDTKILLSEDKEGLNAAIRDINKIAGKLNAILPVFETETGYSLTREDITRLISSPDQDDIIDKVNSKIKEGFPGAKIKGLMEKTLFANTTEFVYSFSNKIKSVVATGGTRHIGLLSLIDGELKLEKEQEEKINEEFRKYLTTETGKLFFEKHKKAVESLNDLLSFIKENTVIEIFHPQQMTGNLFLFDTTTKLVSLTDVAYERALKPNLNLSNK